MNSYSPALCFAARSGLVLLVLCSAGAGLANAAESTGSVAAVRAGEVQARTAYTPARGSTERKAILSALRSEMRRSDSRSVVFVVRHLRVQQGWAWLQVEPQSRDGRSRYEGEAALLQRRGGRWRVVERMPAFAEREGTRLEAECAYFEQLRSRFRTTPAAIFPEVDCSQKF